MTRIPARILASAIAAVLVLGACSSEPEELVPAEEIESVGLALPDAISALEDAGYTVTYEDTRESRSIWNRSNWVVTDLLSVDGTDVVLGVDKVEKAEKADKVEKAEDGPTAETWDLVTDGTWEYGDVGFGEPAEARLSEYAITVTGPPQLLTEDGGKTVTVTSPLEIVRVKEPGSHDQPGTPIADSERIFFNPGVRTEANRYNEAHGTRTDVICEGEVVEVGDATSCTVSYRVDASEVRDSYWTINGSTVAAWPGQVP